MTHRITQLNVLPTEFTSNVAVPMLNTGACADQSNMINDNNSKQFNFCTQHF